MDHPECLEIDVCYHKGLYTYNKELDQLNLILALLHTFQVIYLYFYYF